MKTVAAAIALAALVGKADAGGHVVAGETQAKPPIDGGVFAAAYPQEINGEIYDNESIIPEVPSGADDALELDDEETTIGGYAAKEFKYCNPYAYSPFGRFLGGESDCAWSVAYFMLTKIGVGSANLVPFNCSFTIPPGDPAVVGKFPDSERVCESAECCSDYWGAKYVNSEYKGLHDRWDARFATYQCGWLNEAIYCHLLFWMTSWCTQQYYGGADGTDLTGNRMVLMPCNNAAYYFLYTCKTFKTIGAKGIVSPTSIEPEDYVKAITAAEANMVLAIFYAIDRVCVPLSEYEPSLAKADDTAAADAAEDEGSTPSSDAPAPSPSSDSPAPSSSDDSAATAFQPVFVFSALAAVFAVVRSL